MAGHGGAWKVAYADFVTAMMAFFMVMWITAQSKSVRQAVSQYFSDPHGTSLKPSGVTTKAGAGISFFPSKKVGDAPFVKGGRGAQGRGDGAADYNLDQPDEQETARKQSPNLFILHDGNRKLIGATIRFTDDSTQLDDWSKDRLLSVCPLLLGKPNRIEIRGHAVRRPADRRASQLDMWKLCYERSVATMNFLVEQGIEPQRIRLSQAGTSEPYSEDTESEWHLQNARVDVFMLGEYVNDPKPTSRTRTGPAELPQPTLDEAGRAVETSAPNARQID